MKTIKKITDIRGQAFLDAREKMAKVMVGYFSLQVQDYIDYIENNPQLFFGVVQKLKTQKGKINKTKKALEKISIDDMEKVYEKIEEIDMEAYIAGGVFLDEKIKGQLVANISFDIDNEETIAFAKESTGMLIANIDDTTQEDMSELIVKAIDEGLTAKETTARIYEKFGKYNEYRSALIANMEVSNAFAAGKDAQFTKYEKKFDVKGWKRNMDQGDMSVRDDHAANSAEGWIPRDQLFSATKTMHEPHGFYCRCYTDYVLLKPNS